QFAWLRKHDPVYRHPGEPDFWAVTRHEDVVHVSRHSELFSSARKLALFDEMPEEQRALQRLMMLNQDPPEHTRRRSLVNRGFTPRAIGALEQHIREICDDLLDDRKSTRLNSSHVKISYAVFCLKKKNKTNI